MRITDSHATIMIIMEENTWDVLVNTIEITYLSVTINLNYILKHNNKLKLHT